MASNPSLVSEALAFSRDSCGAAKTTLEYSKMPTNTAEEGVVYAGDAAGTVHLRLYFPNATTVAVATSTTNMPLTRGADGVWHGSYTFATGLHFLILLVDGQDVMSPYLPIAYSYCRPVNYIDVPPTDPLNCSYLLRRGIHYGTVAHDVIATTDGAVAQLLVYLPPSYRELGNATRRYPVLYLQHGFGGNENGWVQHGKLNVIADNLIADGKMTEMIIVMGNGIPLVENGRLNALGYTTRLVQDIIPYVDSNYRTLADRDHRAMAGLSVGSAQATCTTMQHPELFSAVGIFSGFLHADWRLDPDSEEPYFAAFRANPQAYRAAMRVVFRAMGDADPFLPVFDADSATLDALGFREDVRKIYQGQAHCWQVWRMCAEDFLPLIFHAP